MVKKAKEAKKEKAPFGRRIIAYLLDSIFASIFIVIGILLTITLILAIIGIPLIIIGFVYFLVKDGLKNGSSWGKRIMGLKVIQLETNKPCTKAQSALRSIFMAITPLNIIEFFVALADKNGQRLADKLLKTQVVEA